MNNDRDDFENADRMMARCVMVFLAIALALVQIGLLIEACERMAGR